MKNRKLQIFLSSTYEDLIDYRLAAIEAILAAGHIPATMEQFTPGDEEAWEKIKRWIDGSDAFFLILGGRYGSLKPDAEQSYVHLEYEYALSKGKPFCSLVIDDTLLQKRVEALTYKVALEQDHPQKFKDFKFTVLRKHCAIVREKSDIKATILQKAPEWADRDDLAGWIRAEDAVSPELANEVALLSTENRELREKIKVAADKAGDPIDEMILEIVSDPRFNSSKPARFSYLQRRASGLRDAPPTAALEEREILRQRLAKILKMQLDACPYQQPDPKFQTFYHEILEELESLRNASESERGA